MVVIKVLGIAFTICLVGFFGFCLGISREDLEWDTNELNGWLVKPFKHFMCGAFYGHEYKQSDPPAGGWVGVRCERCGKYKARKTVVRHERP